MPIPQLSQSPKNWEKYKKSKPRRHSPSLKKPSSHKRLRPSNGKWDKQTIIKWVLTIGIGGFLLGSIFLVGIFAYYSQHLPDPDKVIDRVITESTKIYDRTGEVLLWEIHGDEKRTIVELENISPYIIQATISAEDKDFYEHRGFKITSLIRAVVVNVLQGQKAQGGSTITQQFIKNAILTTEKKYERKIKEIILAYQIEQKFSKDDILKLYFNEIPFGGVNYGVESAANYYFGKSASEVTLPEAAILAAVPNAPTRLSPYGSHTDELFARQRWILDQMASEGYITKQEAEEAKNTQLEFKQLDTTGIKAPHFVFYVQEQLGALIGENKFREGGLTIITSLDWERQQKAEEIISQNRERLSDYGASNASLVSVDAKTGEILTMVGSVDFTDEEIDGQVNVSVRPRQPGSSIKPVAYAAAFEKGFFPETVVYDVKTSFPGGAGGPYEPQNYDFKERGPITLRSALAGSLNIPAVKALYLAGVPYTQTKMQELGYSTISDDTPCGLSLVLGGCEVTLLDHVGAFTAFARDGERAETAAILTVKDKSGKTIHEFTPRKHEVWDSQTARRVNSIMSDDEARAYAFGRGSLLTLPGRPVAAKTGTTQENKDNWTIGFTPSVVTGVWVGNSSGENMGPRATGAGTAAPIWNAYMRAVLDGTPVESFKEPNDPPEDVHPMLRGEVSDEIEYEIDRASGKLATELTPESFREKKTYREAHSILHYVDKNNPHGPVPEDPAAIDPQYSAWESAILDWLRRDAEKKAEELGVPIEEVLATDQKPPQEYDDLHTEANRPSISLTQPSSSVTVEDPQIAVSVSASAPRGVSRVEYYVADTIVAIARTAPFSTTLNLTAFPNGFHTLRAVAYDDIDNSQSDEVELNIQLPYQRTTVNWISPRNNASYLTSNFPLQLSLSLNKIKDTNKIRLFLEDLNGGRNQIGEISEISGDALNYSWQSPPPPGEYRIVPELEEATGERIDATPLGITIQQ